MKKQSIFLIFFLIHSVIFSQQQIEVYQNGVMAFDTYNYKEALQHFNTASDQFLKRNNTENYLKSQLYISNIQIYKNKYPSALETIHSSIQKYTSARIHNDSLWGELMNTKAMIYRLDGNGKEALKTSDAILKEQLQNPEIQAYSLIKTYTIRSTILMMLSRYDESLIQIQEAFKFPEHIMNKSLQASLLNNLGSVYLYKEDFDKAYDYYNRSYQLKLDNNAPVHDLAITTFNIGIISEVRGDYNEAIRFYNASAKYDLQNQGEGVGFISDIYVALSNAYNHKNNFEKSEEYIEKALQKAIEIFGEDHLNVANVYASYARILRKKGKQAASLEFDRKALGIRERTYGVYNRFSIENLKSIAKSYVAMEHYHEAEKNYLEVLRRIKKMNSKVQEAYCYRDMGAMYLQLKEYKKAINFFNMALTNFSESFYQNHRHVLKAELSLAKALFSNENYKESSRIIKNHLDHNDDPGRNYPSLTIEAIDINNNIVLAYYKKSGEIDSLKRSYKKLDLLIRSLQNLKKEYTTQGSIINISNEHANYFENAIEICHILYKRTGERYYLEKAFQLSEINRNSTLLAGIRDERFKKMAGVPDSLLQQENTIRQKLAGIKKQMYREKRSVKADSLISLRLQYSIEWDSLLAKIEKEYPKYYQLKYSNQTIPILTLQKEYLDKNTTIIEYYLGKENLYVFVLNKNEVNFRKLPISSLVKFQVKKYRAHLIRQQNIEDSSKKLFDLVLKDVNFKENIILITDDVLNYVPFETLIDGDEYVLNKHVVSYVGSATLLQTQTEDFVGQPKKEIPWSGFAPKYEAWNSFSSNTEEIKNIARLMKGSVFLDSEASIKNFVAQIGNSSIIHIAAHAQIDHNNPMYNKLIFAKDTVKNELTASEIYTLSIPSELVVLSACNTGFGKLEKGEGVMSMSRAFHYAGAKSTVMSLWKVPDKETAIIMNTFYRNLKKGLSKDKALQQAKLKYMENTKDNLLKHPYYWAGLVVSGNTEPLQGDSSYWWWILIVALILVFVFRKRLIQPFK